MSRPKYMSIRPDGSLSEVPPGTLGPTGRKIIVDTYGGYARHGGGAFSGKDPTKVDRSASYAARYVAKNIVAAGLADRCEVQVAYAIGVARPVSVLIDTAGTAVVPEEEITRAVLRHVDLRPLLSSAGLTSAARSTVRLPPTVTWDGGSRTRRGKRGIWRPSCGATCCNLRRAPKTLSGRQMPEPSHILPLRGGRYMGEIIAGILAAVLAAFGFYSLCARSGSFCARRAP